jgi:hypothetical protein
VVAILRDARGSRVILGERRENEALQHIITVMVEENGVTMLHLMARENSFYAAAKKNDHSNCKYRGRS